MLKTGKVETAVRVDRDALFRFGTALMFMVGVMLVTVVRTRGGGTLIAGDDVVGTIGNASIDPVPVADRDRFVWPVIAAVLLVPFLAVFRRMMPS